MDQRIEAFLADVLALAGENPDAIREGVRVALAEFLADRVGERCSVNSLRASMSRRRLTLRLRT
jgi:hypothetical protein